MNSKSLRQTYSPEQLAGLAAQWRQAQQDYLRDAENPMIRRSVRLEWLREAETASRNAQDFERAQGTKYFP